MAFTADIWEPGLVWEGLTLNNTSLFNPFPNDKFFNMTKLKAFADDKLIATKMTISLLIELKTLWEKRKMLVTNIFFFSHSVFQNLLLQGL